MSKLEKQRIKMKERIEDLEFELKNSLQKKAVGSAINIVAYTNKIAQLRQELAQLK